MMDGNLIQALVWATVVILTYAVLSRGLLRATEQHRYNMLETANELLGRSDLTDDDRQFIEHALDTVYSTRGAWRVALSAVEVLFSSPFTSHEESQYVRIPDSFKKQWIISMIGNSPAAALITVVLMVLISAFSAWADVVSKVFSRASGHDDDSGHSHQVADCR